MNEIWKMDATAQAALVREREVHPRELVELALDRIEALDPLLNATFDVRREAALARANAPVSGPFAGVPILLKDLLPFPGFRCAFGSSGFGNTGFVHTSHVPYSARVETAGFIALGKTTTSEYGLLGSTEARVYGTTRNPWDLDRSACGSSGGSAAAVAAGLVPLAHASDGGGSIRIPAAVCGLFGFKPSTRREAPTMPAAGDFLDLTSDHCVSRSVRDSARLLACTEDPDGPWPLIGMVEPATQPRRLRIGVYTSTLLGRAATSQSSRAIEVATGLCQDLGHRVEPIETFMASESEPIAEAFFTVAAAAVAAGCEMAAAGFGRPLDERDLEPFTLALLRWANERPPSALASARSTIRRISARATAWLERCDVIMSPTLGVHTPELAFLAPSLDFETVVARTEQLAGYTPVHNMAGAPAMSVPLVHASEDDMPVGVHFAAAPGSDATLLELAYQLEEAKPWKERWPPMAQHLARTRGA